MGRSGRHRLGGDCRGTALVTVLMMMLALFSLSSILMDASSNYLNAWVAPNVRNARALYVAEGGARLALQWFRDSYKLPQNTYFTESDGKILYNSQPVVLPSNHPDPYTDKGGTSQSGTVTGFNNALTNQSLGKGTFNAVATLLGTNPQQWRIASTGTVAGVSKGVTVQVRQNPYNPPFALVTGGDLTIGGNSQIAGTFGNAHSNGNLTVGNSISVAGTATGSGTCSGCDGHVGWGGGRPKADIPEVNPEDFRQYATYELRSDGQVYCGQAGASVGCTPGVLVITGPATEWSYAGSRWTLSSNSATNGAFYIEGEAHISGSPGSNSTPWQITLIATGSIEIAGNPTMKTYTQNLSVVTGDDLTISGNPDTDIAGTPGGIMAARNELNISGNPRLKGFIVSEDAEISSITIGNPTITYNGGLGNNPFLGQLEIVSWMEN